MGNNQKKLFVFLFAAAFSHLLLILLVLFISPRVVARISPPQVPANKIVGWVHLVGYPPKYDTYVFLLLVSYPFFAHALVYWLNQKVLA